MKQLSLEDLTANETQTTEETHTGLAIPIENKLVAGDNSELEVLVQNKEVPAGDISLDDTPKKKKGSKSEKGSKERKSSKVPKEPKMPKQPKEPALSINHLASKILSKEIATNKDFEQVITGHWEFKNGKTSKSLRGAIAAAKNQDGGYDSDILKAELRKLLVKMKKNEQ